MPKPNYAFEKRQRELTKKQKKMDKQKRKDPAPPLVPPVAEPK